MRTLTRESAMADTVAVLAPQIRVERHSPYRETWRRFRQQGPAVLGLAILLLLVLACIAAPLLTPYNPEEMKLSDVLIPPNSAHPLGTDHLGRDMLARLLYGGRLSLMIGFLAVGIGLLIGIPLGAVSGYYGGWVDMLIQRVADILLSFPSILLALSLVAVLGVGLRNVIISVGISTIPSFIRLVRGSVLSIREETYVEAARSVGVRDWDIIRRHILVNAMAPVIVQATLSLGSTILVAAGLGFLGLGVQPPTPEWGSMLGEGRQYIFSASYIATFPGLAIFLAVLGFNLLGDGLRDALDPRLRK
ncbi:MAG: ABC transporter permease [Anaerolineae bacterium]|nr:ABC transporter permease [Anaerolineae bacterium]